MRVLGLVPARGGSKSIPRKNIRPLAGKPLLAYTRDDIRREYRTEKSCAPHCTVSCVHQVSYVDFFRAPQSARPMPSLPEESPDLVQIQSD